MLMTKKIKGICEYCGKEFEKVWGIKNLCTAKCKKRYTEYNKEYREKNRTQPILHLKINCKMCGKEFIRKGIMQKYCGNRKDKNSCSYKIYRRDSDSNMERAYHQPKRHYKMYMQGAKRRGKEFSITMEEFMQFWQKPCYYCADPVEYIGIDRLDNDVGYIKTNIVSCCTECNFLKKGYSKDFFIGKCIKIARQHWTEGQEKELKEQLEQEFISEDLGY